jgi:hypothetical protein
MRFFLALVVWFIMAAILAAGIVMAAHGQFALLVGGLLVFVLLLVKFGCVQH